ncbi:hypothetical protein E2651_03805 [Streptomyces sp. MZ04]|nr:hypothetical protein E2651_03805 [Streptomyces sp. MZ04]
MGCDERAHAAALDGEYEWLVTHGDLQIAHVFVDGDEITGIVDWSEAGPSVRRRATIARADRLAPR